MNIIEVENINSWTLSGDCIILRSENLELKIKSEDIAKSVLSAYRDEKDREYKNNDATNNIIIELVDDLLETNFSDLKHDLKEVEGNLELATNLLRAYEDARD